MPVLVALGLAGRFGLPGLLGDTIGGVTYAALAYVLIALLRPGWRPLTVGLAAFTFSAAIELLQLSGIAAELVEFWSPLKLVVGSSFVAGDFLAYAAGAAFAAAVDHRRDPPAGI